MKKKRIVSVLLSTVIAVGATAGLLSACGKSGPKAEVVYHLNYNDAGERTVEIPTGSTAVDWNAVRDGYKITAWYTDAECKNEFDFSKEVTGNLDLYAGWKVDEGKVPVTFDYNYPGARSSFTVSVEKNGKVATRYVPAAEKVNRLGMKLDAWYKDAACTQKFDFENDTADSALTLYAGYVANNTLPRDSAGNIVYENVQVNVWMDDSNCRDQEILQTLAAQFNSDPQYQGKIHVNVTKALVQSAFSLRLQSTPEKCRTEGNYYSASDIYAMAEIDYSFDDWYEGALQDSVYKGALTSVPLFASVPYIVYNKNLMTEYNGNDPLPTNYSELSALLKKAYDGEVSSKSNFKPFLTDTSWKFKEATSTVAFLQNNAEYYSYDNEKSIYVNGWETEKGKNGALTALQNTYALFGTEGDCHGGTTGDNTAVGDVRNGNALMCIVNYMNDYLTESPDLGIMPLSGLFTDGTDKAAARIPINTVGLAFYKASAVSQLELAAGAVFADYCSKHSEAYAKNGWYPIRKSTADTSKWSGENAKYKAILENVGDPENFYTFSGYNNGKYLVNKICAEAYIVPMLSKKQSELDYEDMRKRMTTALGFEINN